ncbi:MAG: hypothetical protein WBO29_00935 [Albidovulum sp.]
MADKKTQKEKFREAAIELGADTDEEAFDLALRKILPVKDTRKEVKPTKE